MRGERLTQGKQVPRFALLNLALACGKLFSKWSMAARQNRVPSCSSSSGRGSRRHGFPCFCPRALFKKRRAGQSGIFQDLRAMSMTKDERAQAAIHHQDTRNLSCRVRLSSPRGAAHRRHRREQAEIRRIRHGIARAIEDLRGLRLPLVSCPVSGRCLLPSL
jgi:hypothetical protein